MSDTEKKVTVILDGDASGLTEAAKRSAERIKQLQAVFGTLRKEAGKDVEDLAQSTGRIGEVLSKLGPAGIAAGAGIGAALGVITAAATVAAKTVGDLVERAGKLTDLATKTSLGTGFLQDLDFVASQVGVSLEDAAGAAGKLQKTLGEAKSGNKEAIAAFEAIGISAERLQDAKLEDIFKESFAALGQVADESIQVKLGSDLMGKSFLSVANLVRTDLVTAFNDANLSGTKLTEEQIAQADDLGDAFTRLGKTVDALKLGIGAEILGAFGGGDAAKGVDTITEAVRGLIALIKDDTFQKFLTTLPGIGAGIAALKFGVQKLADNAPRRGVAVLSDAQIAEKNKVTGPDLFTTLASDPNRAAQAKARSAEAKQAQQEAEAYARELEKLAAAETKAAVEGAKRWAAEEAAVRKVNDEVKQRIGAAGFSIFGTSPQAADAAIQKFDDMALALGAHIELLGEGKVSYEGLSVAIQNLSETDLARYEQELMKAEVATRGNAAANEVVRKTLREVQAQIDKMDMAAEFEKPAPKLEVLVDRTQDLTNALDVCAGLAGDLGAADLANFLGGLSRAIDLASKLQKEIKTTGKLSTGGKIAAGQEAIGIGVDAFQGADTKVGKSTAKGALTGAARGAALGSVIPGIGTVAGGVIGGVIGGVGGFLGAKKKIKEALKDLNAQLVQQFGSMEKARAAAKKYGIDLDKALSSKSPEKLAKAMDELAKATQKEADKLAGLESAQSSVEQLQDLVAESTNEKLKASVGALATKVADEMAKAGLGFFATGALRQSEQFKGAQSIAQATAGTVGGLRQAGVVDAGVIAAAGSVAIEAQKQAFEAAKAEGLSDAEAQKASFGAVNDLLREQLNASLASGQELDANTKALIEEARKNGIEILADPAIEAVAVAKDQLSVLKQIATAGGKNIQEAKKGDVPQFAGGSGGFLNFGAGTMAELHGIEGVFRPQDLAVTIPRLGASMPTFASREAEAGARSENARLSGGGASQVNFNIAVDENPFRTADTARQMREFTLRTVQKELRRDVANALAAGGF